MARLPDFAQGIVALDVGPGFGRQRQSLGRLYRRRVRWLPVDQAVQQVQDMGLGRDAGLQRQFDGGKHGLFVMLEDQGQDLDHLAVAARRLEHALLQSPEGGRQFDERRAVTQGSRLALNNREIVPPVVNCCGALPFVGAGKNAVLRGKTGARVSSQWKSTTWAHVKAIGWTKLRGSETNRTPTTGSISRRSTTSPKSSRRSICTWPQQARRTPPPPRRRTSRATSSMTIRTRRLMQRSRRRSRPRARRTIQWRLRTSASTIWVATRSPTAPEQLVLRERRQGDQGRFYRARRPGRLRQGVRRHKAARPH